MIEENKVRRKIRIKEMCRRLGCGHTQFRELVDDGHIRPPQPLWPGARVKGCWEDEFEEDLKAMDEKVRAEAAADEEKRQREIASGERRFGAVRPRDPSQPRTGAVQRSTSALAKGPRKAVHR